MEGKNLRTVYGETLAELGREEERLVVLDADLSGATMTKYFREAFPERFYDFGIAEMNLVCEAAGMALSGLKPFVSTFAMFGAGRAFEAIRNSVCYPELDVKFVFTHAGISVGEDGGSHQCVEDIALMRVLPNMKVVVPCDGYETKKAVRALTLEPGPVYLRLGRGGGSLVTEADSVFEIGKASVLKDGTDVVLIACGQMVWEALRAAEELERRGVSAAVVNMHTIKPLDAACIRYYAGKCKKLITLEEHSIFGGLGSAVAEVVSACPGAELKILGVRDSFGRSGPAQELLVRYGLTAKEILTAWESMA
ncbi:MAG: transketolase family protein [Lachnospiraceae bacterium]|nr:transketolase family protein [Lachnospiraceae bacterium]